MVSDNGATFKSAAKFLKNIMSDENVNKQLAERRVEWVFNIERAPWWGGLSERMVQTTKRCLRKMIGRAKLNYDELATLIIEVEAIVNSRPLSYLSTADLDEPLTLSHLLTGRRLLSLPEYVHCEEHEDETFNVSPAGVLTKCMRFLERVLQDFWKWWRQEYLLQLRHAHASDLQKRTTGSRRVVCTGDVVVVQDENAERGFWKLGVVEELVSGKDDEIRGAVVRVYTGGRKCKRMHRPVQRLYPIEVGHNAPSDPSEPSLPHEECVQEVSSKDCQLSSVTVESEVPPTTQSDSGELPVEVENVEVITEAEDRSQLPSKVGRRLRPRRVAAQEA